MPELFLLSFRRADCFAVQAISTSAILSAYMPIQKTFAVSFETLAFGASTAFVLAHTRKCRGFSFFDRSNCFFSFGVLSAIVFAIGTCAVYALPARTKALAIHFQALGFFAIAFSMPLICFFLSSLLKGKTKLYWTHRV